MSTATVGRIEFGPAPVGAVLKRPTGTEALAWILYAASLDREAKLRKKLHKHEHNRRVNP